MIGNEEVHIQAPFTVRVGDPKAIEQAVIDGMARYSHDGPDEDIFLSDGDFNRTELFESESTKIKILGPDGIGIDSILLISEAQTDGISRGYFSPEEVAETTKALSAKGITVENKQEKIKHVLSVDVGSGYVIGVYLGYKNEEEARRDEFGDESGDDSLDDYINEAITLALLRKDRDVITIESVPEALGVYTKGYMAIVDALCKGKGVPTPDTTVVLRPIPATDDLEEFWEEYNLS